MSDEVSDDCKALLEYLLSAARRDGSAANIYPKAVALHRELAVLRAQLAAHARFTEAAADAAARAMREACLAAAAWNDDRFDGYDPRDVQETIEGAIRRLPLRALPLDAPGGEG